MRYDTVLFDLDHTLLDTEHSFGISFESAMRSAGVADPPSVRAMFDEINNSLWAGIERGAMNPDELHQLRFQMVLEQLGLDADPVAAADRFARSQIENATLYAGARELIGRTTEQCRTGLITNGIGLIQRGVLRTLGLEDVFDAVIISSEIDANKPSPEFFDAVFVALEMVDRSTAVVVGDSLTSDIQGGTNAGVDTIWFNRHGTDTGKSTPTHTVHSLAELSHLLATI